MLWIYDAVSYGRQEDDSNADSDSGSVHASVWKKINT